MKSATPREKKKKVDNDKMSGCHAASEGPDGHNFRASKSTSSETIIYGLCASNIMNEPVGTRASLVIALWLHQQNTGLGHIWWWTQAQSQSFSFKLRLQLKLSFHLKLRLRPKFASRTLSFCNLHIIRLRRVFVPWAGLTIFFIW